MRKFSKNALKRRVTTTFELPPDIMLDLPTMSIVGDEELMLTNHKGIIEYTKGQLRIKTSMGIIKILGPQLVIKEISQENVIVAGKIESIVFQRGE